MMRGRHCWVDVENWRKGWQVRAFCVADEHYIPTMLALYGLENQTDCTVSIMASSTWLNLT